MLLQELVLVNDTPEANLARVKAAVAPDDLDRIRSLESRGMPPAQVLDTLKTWHLPKQSENAKQ